MNNTNDIVIAKADSGATANYWREEDMKCLTNVKHVIGPSVQLPNGNSIQANQEGYLHLSKDLNTVTKKVTILPELKSASLLSLGKLCDDNCNIFLDKNSMKVTKNNKCILTGIRNANDGLWDVPFRKHPNPKASIQVNYVLPKTHNIYPKRQLQSSLYINNKKPKTKEVIPTFIHHLHHLAEETRFNQILEKQKDIDNKTHKINIIIRKKQPQKTLAQYLHATCYSPVPSTFITAIKNGNFDTWPGLTPHLINKHLPPSISTAKGHIRQEYSGLQSTKAPSQQPTAMAAQVIEETNTPITNKNKDIIAMIIEREPTKGYLDLTGRFPYKSAQGNQYIFVAFHVPTNAILAKAIKNRESEEITKAWTSINDRLETAKETPDLYIIDNEASSQLKDTMNRKGIEYQLVPPHNHRANLAERAIQTFKYHMKSGLASVHPDYPVAQWDRLIEQAEITLNLLRNSNTNPKLSAYAHLFGPFNFNKTPMAPPGSKVVVHLKQGQRDSWGPNGEVGFYVGPSMEHYRCMKVYIPKTRTVRVVDTLTFIPHCIPFPQLRLDDYLRQAAEDIVHLLKNPPSNMIPSLQAGKITTMTLENLATILNRVDFAIPTPTQLESKQNDKEPRVVKHKIHNGEQSNTNTTHDSPFTNTKRWQRQRQQQNHYNLRKRNVPAGGYAMNMYEPSMLNHIYDEQGKKLTILQLLNGSNKKVWNRSMSNELGRLTQGNDFGVKHTNTMQFIHKHEVPRGKKVTYANFRADHRPLKPEPYRIRCVVGGDKLDCDYDTASPTTDLIETKLLINSTISDARRGARFCSVDLKDFFLSSIMKDPEFMKLHISFIPDDIMKRYNLAEKAVDGFVYIRIDKGMYGLKQAAVLANQQLQSNLAKEGYYPIPGTSGLWKHRTRQTKIVLCIDDFGVKTFCKADLDHFLHSIKKYYDYHIDETGSHYIGLTLDWQYDKGVVEVSMPGYIRKLLKRTGHPTPTSPQHSPHEHLPFVLGSKGTRQLAIEDNSPPVDKRNTKHVQSVVGGLLYYARAIDSTILPALSSISTQQSNPTENTMRKVKRLLDYVATFPDTCIRFHASNMKLHIDSDAAYLCEPKAKSRAAGYFYFKQNTMNKTQLPINHPLTVECKLLKHVVSSAAEAEVSAIFHNAQTGIIVRRLLQHLGHPQPPTPLKTDNTTAERFVSKKIHQKRSKTWDMRFYWLRDQQSRQNFKVFWRHGCDVTDPNLADYFTKHHTVKHHRSVRPQYIIDKNV